MFDITKKCFVYELVYVLYSKAGLNEYKSKDIADMLMPVVTKGYRDGLANGSIYAEGLNDGTLLAYLVDTGIMKRMTTHITESAVKEAINGVIEFFEDWTNVNKVDSKKRRIIHS